MTTLRRIQKELAEIHSNPIPNITASPKSDDDLLHWQATITGPTGTPYKNGKFELSIAFPSNYPFSPPVITFVTRIYHPNVSSAPAPSSGNTAGDSNVCHALLKPSEWKPSTKLTTVLEAMVDLLINPRADDPLEPNVAQEYLTDKNKFETTAKEWVKRYALA